MTAGPLSGMCGCKHPVSAHAADGKCTEWWRYPDVLDARQCGCVGVWQPTVASQRTFPTASGRTVTAPGRQHLAPVPLSEAEAATVARFEAAPYPAEVLREKVARALHDAEPRGWLHYADAAIAVIRGASDE